jgi:DNA-binding CsgD family transcriptional regulator
MRLLRLDDGDRLVGRDGERALLRERVSGAAGGAGVILVVGGAGTGKSSLLRAGLHDVDARRVAPVIVQGGVSRAGSRFSGLQRVLHSYRENLGELAAAERRAVEHALDLHESSAVDPVLVGRAFLRLIRAGAADRPVVLGIDDLHRFDAASTEAVSLVARHASEEGVLVIATTRVDRRSFADVDATLVDLRGLAEEDARALLARDHPGLGYVEREYVLRCAAGNPLALVEMPGSIGMGSDARAELMVGRSYLTPALQRSFGQGLCDLTSAARDAVLVAAVDDRNEVAELLGATSEFVGRSVGVEVFEEPLARGLLHGDDLRLSFPHDLVRSAVIHEENMVRRHDAHRAIATVARDPARSLWHLSQSVVLADEELGDELGGLVDVTLERATVGHAVAVLERGARLAAQPSKRVRRLLRAAGYACSLGRADVVDRLIDDASRQPLSAAERARAEALRDALRGGDAEDSHHIGLLCERAREATSAPDADLALDLLLTAAELSWWVDARREVRLEISRIAEAASGSDHDSRLIAIRALVDPIANGGAVIMGLRQVDARTVHDPTTLRNLGLAAYAVGDPEMALVVLGQAERQCREQALLGLLPHILCVQAAAHGELGDWELAASRAAESEDAAQGTGQTSWLAAAKAHRARALALQSDSEGALALADESERLALQRGLHGVCVLARAARGAAWLGAGRYAEAFDELVSIFDNADPGRTVRKRMAAVSLLVEAAVRTDRVEDVRSVVGELERMGDVTIAPLLQVQLHSVRPQLASDDDAEAAYRSALDEDLSRWAWSRALIELGYGSWLRRQRRVLESRTYLRHASTVFDIVGAAAWAELARTELRAAGERRDDDAPVADLVLSPQELEIAKLAADGLSNREIGHRLLLSHRTVGAHLYRIFPKLGITSRRQLVARLGLLARDAVVAA